MSTRESHGGRLRFHVELRPGETTIVSWKKLSKETTSSKPNGPAPTPAGPSSAAHPQPQPPPPSSKEMPEKEVNDAGTNRLSTVIEKIERMYAGDGSSEDEEVILDDIPDDDEYDTEDSFIDDAELDDYFQVDNSSIKHDGFFVNRGKLERMEPATSAKQQPKKRRRKEVIKTQGSLQNKDADQPKIDAASLQNHNFKLKDCVELQDISDQKLSSLLVSKPHYGKLNSANELDQSVQQKDKSRPVERFDLNIPLSKELPQMTKVPLIPRKDGSIVRPKITALDKAIRELEKIVAESRPPSTEVQDPDNSSQGVKRRLSPEIKQKLSKVARLAQVSYGKIPKDVINRLMSILGHLMQLRSLKRNLRVMASLGLSARQEKDDRLQKTKQEVADMVKQRVHYMKSKVQQQTANSDDFQEISQEEKEALKRKHSMDAALENKICDLYDLYVERLEEDSGPPVRRLYEELAALWPGGIMDTDGIKRAIHKAKDRRKALGVRRRDQEMVKRKKVFAQKMDDTIQREASKVNPAIHFHEKHMSNSHDHVSPLMTKQAQSAAVSHPEPYVPVPVSSIPNVEKPKQEKVKASPNSNPIDDVSVEVPPKKKVKKKQNQDSVEAPLHPEKVLESEERQTS